MINREPRYSDPWMGQDGNEWRSVEYWVGNGWSRFLQRRIGGQWMGW